MSLRTRVTLLAAVCVGLAVALASLGAFLTVSSSLYQQLTNNLEARAYAAAKSGALTDPEVVQKLPPEALGAGDIRVALVEPSGIFVSSQGQASAPPLGQRELEVSRGQLPKNVRIGVVNGQEFQVVAVPATIPPLSPGAGQREALVLAQPMAPLKSTLKDLSVVLIIIGGAGVLLAAAAGTAVARAGLRPVERLTQATEWVARTGELRPIPVSGDDELARLTQSFNAMLAGLAESQERQRRLVADAGHELRTPLTSLRTNLELLLASEQPGAPTLSEQDRTEIHADVHAQLDELTTLIGDLVELAREDTPQVVHEPVELVEIVQRAVDRAQRRASGITFDMRLQPWTLLGDANALERAVLNMLDNAAKWSPPGGPVRVELRWVGDGSTVLEVADAGPGIADADLPHVFERFYRSSEARTLPGSGLGLAIVRQAAERHGGAAYAGRAPEGGALLTLRLPGHPG
jgi:two-component system sensor histidine kinase MprB